MEHELTEEELNKIMYCRSAVRWRTRMLMEQGMEEEEANKQAFYEVQEKMYGKENQDSSKSKK